MNKLGLFLNEDKTIRGYNFPTQANQTYDVEIETDTVPTIHFGLTKYINGEFIQPSDEELEILENARKQRMATLQKISELERWFEWFDYQNGQQWQKDFTISHDDYFNKDYANIEELYEQAELVKKEITKLRSENGIKK